MTIQSVNKLLTIRGLFPRMSVISVPKVYSPSRDLFCQTPTFVPSPPVLNTRLFSTASPQVVHNETDHEFSLSYDGHQPAYLRYRYLGPDSVQMYTTVVPDSLGGRGVAKILANTAFDWAVAHNLKMSLTCWYLSGYLKRHPREDMEKLVL